MWSDQTGLTATAASPDRFWVGCQGGATFYSNAARTTGSAMAPGGSFEAICDRNKKENFADVDANEILGKVAELPIYLYNFKGNGPDIVCIGPVAQEWHAAFPSAKDGLTIEFADMGVALAAIKALLAKTRCSMRASPRSKRENDTPKLFLRRVPTFNAHTAVIRSHRRRIHVQLVVYTYSLSTSVS